MEGTGDHHVKWNSQTQKDKYHIFTHVQNPEKKTWKGLLGKKGIRERGRRIREENKYIICIYEYVTLKPIILYN
jgi:hypothetical protein